MSDGRYSRTVVEGVLQRSGRRDFTIILGLDGVTIGRWTRGTPVATLPVQPSNPMALSREVTQKLSGNYSVQENGLAQNISLEVAAGIAERRAGIDSAKYYKKLDQLRRSGFCKPKRAHGPAQEISAALQTAIPRGVFPWGATICPNS